MKLPTPLLRGSLVKRYRRSLVDVTLDDGTMVTAHCGNPGPMVGCCTPGNDVILSDSGNPSRRHRLTWELIQTGETWVCINPTIARRVVFDALQSRLIPSLQQYKEIERETLYGAGMKIDLILQGMERNCFLNIFNVTWAEKGTALFPDVAHQRYRKSIADLTEIANQGHSAVAFFFVQRGDCTLFRPAEHIDREFLKALLHAEDKGVEILVYRASITVDEIGLGTPLAYALA